MLKCAGLGVLALGLAFSGSTAEKLLKEAQFSLTASIEKAGKDLKDVTPVSAWLRTCEGRTVYTVRFAQGEQTLAFCLDAKTGEVVKKETEKRNRTKALAGSKTSIASAIEIALKKVPGQAYRASLVLEKKTSMYEVLVLSDGKRFEVEVNAATGEIIEVEQEDDDDDDDDEEDDDEDGDDDDGEDDDDRKK